MAQKELSGWARSEKYAREGAQGEKEQVEELFGLLHGPLAQDLYDKGLIFLVNQCVLHHYGYALGVDLDKDSRVIGLSLFETDDPDGVWFDEDLLKHARGKLRRAGLLGVDPREVAMQSAGAAAAVCLADDAVMPADEITSAVGQILVDLHVMEEPPCEP